MQNDPKKYIKLKSAPFFDANQFAKAAAFLMLRAQIRYQKAVKDSLISSLREEVSLLHGL